jgi:hypothetical protein
VNVTEQLVTLAAVDRVHDVADKLPPVEPGVRVNVTVPVGALVAAVVSATVATTLAEQLLPPNAMVQLTAPTLVDVPSFTTGDIVTDSCGLVLIREPEVARITVW